MARKSASDRLLDTIDTDPRFMMAGPAARWIWLGLVRTMLRLGTPSVLSFGSAFGSWKDVARWLHVPETQFETELQTLAAHDLIILQPDGMSLPEWLRDRRAEAARANGAKGGRPRKNASPEGQRSFVMGMPSTQTENPAEPKMETLSRAGAGASPPHHSEESYSGGEVSPRLREAEALLLELKEAGRMEQRQNHDARPIAAWLEMGATPDLLRRVFAEVAARPANRNRSMTTGFFDGPVRDALRATGAAPAPVAVQVAPEDPAIAALRAESKAMWARFEAEGRVGPCPPAQGRWIDGTAPDRLRWAAYIAEGPSVFREVA